MNKKIKGVIIIINNKFLINLYIINPIPKKIDIKIGSKIDSIAKDFVSSKTKNGLWIQDKKTAKNPKP